MLLHLAFLPLFCAPSTSFSSFRLSPTRFAVVGLGLTQGLTLEGASTVGDTHRTEATYGPGDAGGRNRTPFHCAWASAVTEGKGGVIAGNLTFRSTHDSHGRAVCLYVPPHARGCGLVLCSHRDRCLCIGFGVRNASWVIRCNACSGISKQSRLLLALVLFVFAVRAGHLIL